MGSMTLLRVLLGKIVNVTATNNGGVGLGTKKRTGLAVEMISKLHAAACMSSSSLSPSV